MPPNVVADSYLWSVRATADTFAQASTPAHAPGAVEQDRWVLIVDEVILIATIVGALMILGSMAYLEWRGRPATTRMRIVQSLVVSDLVLGVVGTVGVSMNLSPSGLHRGNACDGIGVLLVATIWSEHMWTLSLAFATFMILIYPLHSITLWLEKRWYWLWLGVWVLSFGLSVMGYELYGFNPSGGICYYPGGLFSELIQFIPRAVVFIIITILYARLFVFLRRPDKIRSPYSDSPTNNDSYTNGQLSSTFAMGPLRKKGLRLPFFRSRHRNSDQSKSGPYEVHIEGEGEDPAYPPGERALGSTSSEIPPWEKVDLPVFQVDGQRYGGPSANLSPTRPRKHPRTRPKTGGSMSTPPTSYSRQFGDDVANGDASGLADYGVSPSALPTPVVETFPHGGPFGPHSSEGYHYPSRDASDRAEGHLLPDSPAVIDLSAFNDIRRGSAATQGSSSGRSGSNGTPSLPLSKAMQPQPSLSDRGSEVVDEQPIPTRQLEHLTHLDEGDKEHDMRDLVSADDEELDLMNVLKTTAPPRSQEDKFAPRAGETVVLVEESMASYLNRKTALLMLWFPLGYVLLFSVSLIRIIYDLAGTPPVVLRAISRWFIFAQGVLDAIIYGLVEWHTKRVVRRKVRKIGMSPTTSPAGQRPDGSGSWAPGSLVPSRKPNSPVLDQGDTIRLGSSQGTIQPSSIEMAQTSTSRRGSHFQGQTSSFTGSGDSYGTSSTSRQHTPLERSILQELAPGIADNRRESSSSATSPKPD